MAISDRLNSIKTHVGNAYAGVYNRGGTIPTKKNIENLKAAIESIAVQKPEQEKTVNVTENGSVIILPDEGKVLTKATAVVDVQPSLQAKTVTPTNTQQVVKPDSAYYGLSQVTVAAAPTETATVTPTKSTQTKTPSSGKVGFSQVTVNPIPDDYIIPSGALEITANGTYDVSGKANANVNVPSKDEEAKEVDLAMASGNQVITPTSGKVFSQVVVKKPTTMLPENIKKDVNIGGVTGTLESGSGAELNIHYGDTAPEDTSKLWIKSTEPASIEFAKNHKQSQGINTLGTKLPIAARSTAAAAVGTKIYLFGGYVSYRNYLNTIREFDTETETITTLSATLPNAMFDITCAVAGTKIYLFGGSGYLNTIQEFDTETKTISTLSVTLPNGASNMAAATVGTKIYLFGGHGSGTSMFNTILEFDTETKTISTLSVTLPTVLHSMPAATVGTKIYIFGGSNNKNGVNQLDTILEFDTETKTITTLSAKLPAVLYEMPAAAVGTKIYLFGGYSIGQSVNTIQEFDTETETITTLSVTLPKTSYQMPAATVGTKIYIFGGDGPSGVNLNTILEFIDFVLASGNVFVQEDFDKNIFTLVPAPTKVEIGVKNVYKGNSNNVAEFVDAYLHDGAKWVNVNTGVPVPPSLSTPAISLVSGTTIQIDTIDDNATTIEVFADGLSIGEVQKQ